MQRVIAPNPAKPPTWRAWKARTGRRWWRYPLAVEWVLEWFVYRLRSLALFELLELAGKLTVLIAIIFWFLEADDRAKERDQRTWALINSVRGSDGEVHLSGAPLEHAHLAGIDLGRAFLPRANLQDADLRDANLRDANLQGASLISANLQGANLQGAFLTAGNLQGTVFWGANLQNANLRDANLRKADLQNTDFQGVRDLTQEQLDEANGNDRTVLPDGLTRPAHWSKAEASESPPPAQPDDARGAPAAPGAPGSDK